MSNWLTRNGTPWLPKFIKALDQARCIGCGRCYKVCDRNVFNLVEREVDDDEYEDDVMMVMEVANAGDCIGCGACGRVCPKQCHDFEAAMG